MSDKLFVPLAVAVATVSDTRTLETDTSGLLAADTLRAAGHRLLERRVVKDDVAAIRALLGEFIDGLGADVVIVTGGTGLTTRDVTPETIEPQLERVIPGFGELFRMLSWQDVGSAALLSRALAGIAAGRVVFVLPGSRAALELALEKLILPELGHLAAEAVKTR